MLNRLNAPVVKDAVDFNLQLLPYKSFLLNNGVPVYTVNAGPEDVIQLELVFYAGNWVEEKPMVASLANRMLRSGTTLQTAFELNEVFEYYGTSLNTACYNETATIGVHTLTKHLPQLLPVFSEILSASIFPQQELQLLIQNRKQALDVNLKKSSFVAGRLIDVSLYGAHHPYGKYSTHEGLDAITRQDIIDFYNRFYKNGQWLVFAAGRLPGNFEEQLNTTLGHLNNTRVSLLPIMPVPATEKINHVINDVNGVQCSLRLARSFPNRHHPDFVPCMVLNTIFGGYFGSRLMSNIREDKGYTYGIHSYVQNHIQQCAWMVSSEVGKDVAAAAITEIFTEMDILRNEAVSDEELLLVKNFMLGTVLGDLDGPFHILGRWRNIILQQLPDNYFDTTIQTIKNITAKEIQLLAQKYLQPEEFYQLTVQ